MQYSSLTHRRFSDFASCCLGTNILCDRWPCCPCFWRPNPRLVCAAVRTLTRLYSRPFSLLFPPPLSARVSFSSSHSQPWDFGGVSFVPTRNIWYFCPDYALRDRGTPSGTQSQPPGILGGGNLCPFVLWELRSLVKMVSAPSSLPHTHTHTAKLLFFSL